MITIVTPFQIEKAPVQMVRMVRLRFPGVASRAVQPVRWMSFSNLMALVISVSSRVTSSDGGVAAFA